MRTAKAVAVAFGWTTAASVAAAFFGRPGKARVVEVSERLHQRRQSGETR